MNQHEWTEYRNNIALPVLLKCRGDEVRKLRELIFEIDRYYRFLYYITSKSKNSSFKSYKTRYTDKIWINLQILDKKEELELLLILVRLSSE
jgi:hypothetical protein